MDPRPFALLSICLAVRSTAGTVRVEVVPEFGNLGSAPSAAPALGAVPLQLDPAALVPALALAPLSFAAPAVVAVRVVTPPAPIAAAPVKTQGRPALIQTLSAPALDASKLGAGGSAAAAEKDFNARAQLTAPSAKEEDAVSAAAAFAPGKRSLLTLAHSGQRTALSRKGEPAAMLLDLVATPESLREMTGHGESRLLIQTPAGRWLLAPRSGDGAYPTAGELESSAGKGGRYFVASKGGLVEWNTGVPERAVAVLRGAGGRFASRVPFVRDALYAYIGVAVRRTSWNRVAQEGIAAGAAPLNERAVIEDVLPPLVAVELPVIAAKLGRSLDAAHKADVLARTSGYRMYWHSAYSYKDHPDHVGIPDGHFRADFGIRLMVKPDWRRLPDLSANYRPLFAHEYVHWLQHEGHISTKYGAEIAAVAVEVLRAIELVGLEQVRAGRAGTVHAGVLSSFEGGREWTRAGFANDSTPYMKGSLAGAAYEAASVTGRPGAAWEFLDLVIAGRGALEPAAAWARVTGAK